MYPQVTAKVAMLFLFVSFVASAGAQRKYPTSFGQTPPPPAATKDEPAQVVPPAGTPDSKPSTSPASSPANTSPAVTPSQTPSAPTSASESIPGRKLSYEVEVKGAQQWTDTGIDLLAGDKVALTSEGSIEYGGINKAAPEGLPRTWREVISALPLNSAGVGALIGRLGTAGIETPFLIGAKKEITAVRNGRLFLGINQTGNEPGTGTYKVNVLITPGSVKELVARSTPVTLPSDFFKNVPRRIQDKDGNPGDMVNFVILGPKDKMQQAFADAGWVLVDKTKSDAVLHALFSTYSKKVYTEMPMSELYLFGRSQDFGYAHAEPVRVVQTRHHLRIWKTEFEIDGQPVWVGAATHDIGFERDNRSQKATAITHKIDPDVDKERQFVEDSLNATGELSALSRVTPPDPLKEAKTATGGSFYSDGRVLVMRLQ